jgi:hypothetical protein
MTTEKQSKRKHDLGGERRGRASQENRGKDRRRQRRKC